MKTSNDVMLKIMCHRNILDRELYILQVLIYWFEREIVSANYDYSKANIDKTLLDNADEILEYLVRNYKNEDILSYKKLSPELYYMFSKHNYGLEDYLIEYAIKKGRLPLHDQPEYEKPWYKKSILEFFKNIFRRKRK
jgi:hypothetical protein